MKYVSAKRVPNGTIEAIGDDGSVWIVPSENTDVAPWPQYLAEGGVIDPADPETGKNIESAPDDLTGGPTLGEIFDGNE